MSDSPHPKKSTGGPRAPGFWSSYWFAPASLVDLAVVRLVVVATQLVLLLTLQPYGWRHIRQVATLPDFMYAPPAIMQILLLGQRPAGSVVLAVYGITLAAGLLCLLGWRTNGSMLAFAAGCTFQQAFLYSFGDLHHPEALLVLALWFLALSPCGRALSLDARRSRKWLPSGDGSFDPLAGWAPKLMRWMLGLVYLDTALKKLVYGGWDWLNGYTLQYYLAADADRWGLEIGLWMAEQHTIVLLLSWMTIIFEATFIVTALRPRLALVYVPIGLAFHTGIFITMRASFWQYLALYAVFIPWHRWMGVKERGTRTAAAATTS